MSGRICCRKVRELRPVSDTFESLFLNSNSLEQLLPLLGVGCITVQ